MECPTPKNGVFSLEENEVFHAEKRDVPRRKTGCSTPKKGSFTPKRRSVEHRKTGCSTPKKGCSTAKKRGVRRRAVNCPAGPRGKQGPTDWIRSGRRFAMRGRFGPRSAKPGYLIGPARRLITRSGSVRRTGRYPRHKKSGSLGSQYSEANLSISIDQGLNAGARSASRMDRSEERFPGDK
jgi:hypothetical protein